MKSTMSIALLFILAFISSCDKDEPKFSSSEIQRALFEMKGTYHGEMSVSYYHGETISEGNVCKAVSKDSLTVDMDLSLMAQSITDESMGMKMKRASV